MTWPQKIPKIPFVYDPGYDDRIAVVVERTYANEDQVSDAYPFTSQFPMPNELIYGLALQDAIIVIGETYGLDDLTVAVDFSDFDYEDSDALGLSFAIIQPSSPSGMPSNIQPTKAQDYEEEDTEGVVHTPEWDLTELRARLGVEVVGPVMDPRPAEFTEATAKFLFLFDPIYLGMPTDDLAIPRKYLTLDQGVAIADGPTFGLLKDLAYPINAAGYQWFVQKILQTPRGEIFTIPDYRSGNSVGMTYDYISDQVQILAAVLKEYHKEHEKMKKEQYEGPNMKTHGLAQDADTDLWMLAAMGYGVLDLEGDAERLIDLLDHLAEFLTKNNIDLTKDKISMGFVSDSTTYSPATVPKLLYIKKIDPEYEKVMKQFVKANNEIKQVAPQVTALELALATIPGGTANETYVKLKSRLSQLVRAEAAAVVKLQELEKGQGFSTDPGQGFAEMLKNKSGIYPWLGFEVLSRQEPFAEPRIINYLANMQSAPGGGVGILGLPGAMGAFDRLCGGKAPSSSDERVTLQEFVQGRKQTTTKPGIPSFVWPTPRKQPRPTRSEKEIIERTRETARELPKPKTIAQVLSENLTVKGSVVKSVVAERNKKISDQVGDLTFRLLPKISVNKIRWDSAEHALKDLYHFVLGRLDIPTMAIEIIECLGLDLSLDDIIDALCDGFLKAMGQDPDSIDTFFREARAWNLTLADVTGLAGVNTTIETGPLKGEDFNVRLLSGQDIIQDIQNAMAVKMAQGAEDPFYQAVLETGMKNADGKKLICEFIMAAIFNLDDLLDYLKSFDETKDPYNAKLKRPVIKKCDVSWKLPDALPILEGLLKETARQLELQLYKLLNKLVIFASRKAIEYIVEICEDKDAPYGQIPFNDLLEGVDDEDLKRAFMGVHEAPREWLAALLATLTANELCQLVSGTASKLLLLHIRGWMESTYPESSSVLSTDTKILTFFKNLGQILNLDACDLPAVAAPLMGLDTLCKDGETPRQAALRQALAEKGLTEEQIDAQLEIDKAVKKDLLSEQANNIVMNQTAQSQADAAINMDDIIANSSALNKSNNLVTDAIFNPMGTAFTLVVSTFIPAIFAEIDELNNEGYAFKNFPFRTLLGQIYSDANTPQSYDYKYLTVQAGTHQFNIYIPTTKFTPAEIDPITKKVIPKTGKITFIGGPGSNQKEDFRLSYRTLPSSEFFPNKERYIFEIVDGDIDTGTENEIYMSVEASGPGVDAQKYFDLVTTKYHLAPVPAFTEFVRDRLVVMRDSEWQIGEGEYWDDISGILYDRMFESIVERISAVIYTSDLFDLEKLKSIEPGIRENAVEFFGLQDIKNMVAKKAQENLSNTDFSGEDGEPTFLGDAIFEGAIKAAIKLYVIKVILKSIFVFSKFRTEDAFYDSLILPFILRQIGEEEPETAILISKFKDLLNAKKKNLEAKLSSQNLTSKPPKPPLTFEEVQNELKAAGLEYLEEPDGPPKQTPDDVIKKCVTDVVEGMTEMMPVILQSPALPQVEQDILADESTEEAEETAAPIITSITALASDMTSQKILDDVEHADPDNDDYNEYLRAAGRPNSPQSTLLRQQLGTGWDIAAAPAAFGVTNWEVDRVHFVELPIGTTVPPGTNWDPGIAAWIPWNKDGTMWYKHYVQDSQSRTAYFTKNPIFWWNTCVGQVGGAGKSRWRFTFNTEGAKSGGWKYSKVREFIVDLYKNRILTYHYAANWPTEEEFEAMLPQPATWPPPGIDIIDEDSMGIINDQLTYDFLKNLSSAHWAGQGQFTTCVPPNHDHLSPDWVEDVKVTLPSDIDPETFEIVITPDMKTTGLNPELDVPQIKIRFEAVAVGGNNSIAENTNTSFMHRQSGEYIEDEMELPGESTHEAFYIDDDFNPTYDEGKIYVPVILSNGRYESRKPKTADEWLAYGDTTLANLYLESLGPGGNLTADQVFAGEAILKDSEFTQLKGDFVFWKQFASQGVIIPPVTTLTDEPGVVGALGVEGAQRPIIQIKAPLIEQPNEFYSIPAVSYFKIDVNGENFNTDTGGMRAYLAPIDHFGPTYEFEIESVTATKVGLKMPISVGATGLQWRTSGIAYKTDHPGANPAGIYQHHFTDEAYLPAVSNPKNWPGTSIAGNFPGVDNKGCQILAMGKKGKMRPCHRNAQGLLALRIIHKDGKDAVAPIYFTTIAKEGLSNAKWWKQRASNIWKDHPEWAEMIRGANFPDIPEPVSLYDEEDKLYQGFSLPIYGDRTAAWDVVDVADLFGELKQPAFPAVEAGASTEEPTLTFLPDEDYRKTYFSTRRLTRPQHFNKIGTKSGGFVIEKYVKLKFRDPDVVIAEATANSNWNLLALAEKIKQNLVDPAPTEGLVVSALMGAYNIKQLGNFQQENVIFEYEGKFVSTVPSGEFLLLLEEDSKQENIPGELKLFWQGLGRDSIPYGELALKEHTMSYTSFVRLLRDLVGVGVELSYLGGPQGELIGRQYRVYDIGSMAALGDIDFPDAAPRICTDADGDPEGGFPGAAGGGDCNSGEIWPGSPAAARDSQRFESVQEFVEWHGSMHPGAKYEIRPYYYTDKDSEIIDSDIWKFEGYEVYMYEQDDSWIETIGDQSGWSAKVTKQVLEGPWRDILDTFKVGIRVSYVTMEDHWGSWGKKRMDSLLSPFVETTAETEFTAAFVDPEHSSVEDHDTIANQRYLQKWGHLLENGDIKDKFGYNEDDKVDYTQGIYIIPLIESEMDPSDDFFPPVLKGDDVSLMDLRTAYPSPVYMNFSPYAKLVFDELYKRLRKDARFKFLFEYVLPSKRMLSINTLFNVLAFEGTFRKECTFKEIFNSTVAIILNAGISAAENPSGTYDKKVEPPDIAKIIEDFFDSKKPSAAQTKCLPNTAILDKFKPKIE